MPPPRFRPAALLGHLDTLTTRIVLTFAGVMAVTQMLWLALFLFATDSSGAIRLPPMVERAASAARLLAAADPADRPRLAAIVSDERFRVVWSPTPFPPAPDDAFAIPFRDRFSAALAAEGLQLRAGRRGPGADDVVLGLPDGSEVTIGSAPPGPQPWSAEWIAVTVLPAAVLILIGAWILRRGILRPLRTMAAAAERIGRGEPAPAAPAAGPREVRQVAEALGRMQERVDRYVADRTRMLAAIAHDLRTPLTRLQLRTEFIDDDELREKAQADIGQLAAIVSATLAFARDDQVDEAVRPVDLADLVRGIVSDLRDGGATVASGPLAPVTVRARPTALRRALVNVVDNACKHGGGATVRVARDDRGAAVVVEDDGPGIPADAFEDVFRPFWRVGEARNMDAGGTGLGLSIARTTVRAHGGDIRLENRPDGGLRATILLPADGDAPSTRNNS